MNDPGTNNGNPNEPLAKDDSTYNGQIDDLHNLMAGTPGSEEDDPLAALRNDPNYAALIRDLEYIAIEARRLFEPSQETPSDKVWENIRKGMDTKSPDA